MPDNFTSEKGQDAGKTRNHKSQTQTRRHKLHTHTKPPNLKGTGLAHGASFSLPGPRPQVSMEFPELKWQPLPLTCVEAGMVRLLLEDALGLGVESEP